MKSVVDLKRKLLKLYIKGKERSYRQIKYLFLPNKKSDWLIVVFSGFPTKNIPTYNYVKTLSGVPANKLFILDDRGAPEKPGTYYLGTHEDRSFARNVCDLITEIVEKQNGGIRHIATAGSSKGGTAALYYALQLPAEAAVIGAPQYYIGSYLNKPIHEPILKSIMGDTSAAAVAELDGLMPNAIRNSENRSLTVYIHYSPYENTYSKHIAKLIEDLREEEYRVVEDNQYTYTSHGDVAIHFPKYLSERMTALTAAKEK